ncbi:MAG TPA: thiamine-phosphate kinase [Caulobacteraceae bacterium]|jgi:thiamine-monophosphate kinase
MSDPPDEFDWIEALRPLTRGEPAAFDLMDDVAVLPAKPGYDLVISEDAMVEGVHFALGEDAAIVARRLLRTSLSDLAAKAAEPFGYTLMVAWPPDRDWNDRLAFIRGLDEDGLRFGIALLGGDTVSTPGPLTVSATVLGWAPVDGAVPRSGALARHELVVCGVIGDGYLGLKAARGEIADPSGKLAMKYRLPEPMFELREALRAHAAAAADVSDGLIADALHLADASDCGVVIDLGLMPISRAADAWAGRHADRSKALLELASGGDDYAIVCATAEGGALMKAAQARGVTAAVVGAFVPRPGVDVRYEGRRLLPRRLGYRHS